MESLLLPAVVQAMSRTLSGKTQQRNPVQAASAAWERHSLKFRLPKFWRNLGSLNFNRIDEYGLNLLSNQQWPREVGLPEAA